MKVALRRISGGSGSLRENLVKSVLIIDEADWGRKKGK
jgi:hypothetical protein